MSRPDRAVPGPTGPFKFALSIRGPRKFSVVYDGVLAAETEAQAADFLDAFRRLLANNNRLVKSKPGPGEVAIRKDSSKRNG